MATSFTADEVLHFVTADDDDFGENFDLGSDDELEFNNYNE